MVDENMAPSRSNFSSALAEHSLTFKGLTSGRYLLSLLVLSVCCGLNVQKWAFGNLYVAQ